MNKFLFIILLTNFLFSQEKLVIDDKYLQTGIDYKEKQYLVFNHPEFYYSKKFNAKSWNKNILKFNETPKTDNFSYNFFHIKGKNYLVHNGCGTVFEFKNDSIIRIDNSFEHKSQFMASPFVYKDEIYYFGGYGLFTFKNILTKFDFKTKEWELVKYSNYNKIPEPRANSLIFQQNDKLYLIGGLRDNFETNLPTTKNIELYDIWELNLKTKEWAYLGELEDKNLINFEYYNSSINDKNIYDYGKLFEFDFDTKTLKSTNPKDKYTFSYFEKFNPETNEIFYVLGNSDESNRKYELIIEDFDSYKSEFTNEEGLIETQNLLIKTSIIVFLLLLISSLAYFFKRRRKTTYENKIILKDSDFYFKDKLINNLSSEENDLLHFFFKCKSLPLPMNEVVDFFSKNDNTPYNTLTKKKDLVLNGLKQKLSFILEINEDDLFITQKNTEDKRIKEIQLNPRYF
jgi:hypothetical protein